MKTSSNLSVRSASQSLAQRMAVAAALVLSLSGAANAADSAKLKIATVDMQQLFKEYYKTSEAQKQINVSRAKIQKEGNERASRLKELETALGTMKKQLEDPSISDTKKQATYAEFQMKQNEGAALQRERQEYLENKNKALNEDMVGRMKSILDEIQKLITEEAKGEDFDYVFDKSGMSTSQVPFLLYTKDATDLTPDLLKKLNKDAPPEAAEDAAPAGGDTKEAPKDTKEKPKGK